MWGHGTHLFQTDEAGQILFLCVSELALLSSLFVPPVEQNIELWLALVLIHQTQTLLGDWSDNTFSQTNFPRH